MERKPKTLLRVNSLIKQRFPSLTQRQIEEALETGMVCGPKGQKVKKGERLEDSRSLDFSKLEEHLRRLRAGNPKMAITVIHEEEDFLVVDKPAGIPSHPISLLDLDTVTHWVFANYPSIATQFPEIQPTIVPHRLDSGTSGVLIVAKTKAGFEKWRELFSQKKVTKKYLAWCWGEPTENKFSCSLSIAHDPSDSRRMLVDLEEGHVRPPTQKASSEILVLNRVPQLKIFLCEVNCTTGVTHQVRVHLSYLGYPLVGDALYDPSFAERPLRPDHHELRAITLSVEETQYCADAKKFTEKY